MTISRNLCVLAGAVAALAVTGAAAGAQTLSLWSISYPSERQNAALASAKALFEERHPGATLEMTFRAIDPHKTALRIAAGASDGPDIYFSWAGPGLGGEYVRAGLSLPLDQYYEQYGWADELSTVALTSASAYGDQKHGVPFRFSGQALYFNEDLFAEAGVEQPPQTYDELVAAAQKLADAGIPALTVGGSVNWHLMRLMDNILEAKCGAETHDALKATTANWSQESCATAAFEDLALWSQKFILSPFMGIDNTQSVNLFVADRAAMMLETDTFVHTLADAGKTNVGLFAFPTDTDRLYGFAEYMYVSTKSQNPDLASEYLDLFVSTEFQTEIGGVFGAIPVNSNAKLGEDAPELTLLWGEIFNDRQQTFVNGDQAFPLAVTTEYFRVMNSVASGDMEPNAAAQALQQFIDNQ